MVEDESEKGERTSEGDQDFLKKIEQTMLSQVVLQGVPGVRKVFLRDAKSTFPDASPSGDGYRDHNEWVLDTEGTNLLEVRPPAAPKPMHALATSTHSAVSNSTVACSTCAVVNSSSWDELPALLRCGSRAGSRPWRVCICR